MHTWASTQVSSVEEDKYGILTTLPNLAFTYGHVCKMSNNHSREHTQHCSIDNIIELAFSVRVDCHCDFKYVFFPWAFVYISYNLAIRTEESYCLVALPGNPDVQSDTLVTIPSETINNRI